MTSNGMSGDFTTTQAEFQACLQAAVDPALTSEERMEALRKIPETSSKFTEAHEAAGKAHQAKIEKILADSQEKQDQLLKKLREL